MKYSPEELDKTMVRVPAGPFVFGLAAEQKKQLADDAGVHPSMLHFHAGRQILTTREFWIDKYPVTRGQFQRFMKAVNYSIVRNGYLVGWTDLAGDLFAPDKSSWPMVGVNAADALAYAKWAGKRLPTEIEWEKAARGTDGRLYPWGNEWKDTACFKNPGNVSINAGAPVGSFPEGASPYGAMDMAGSVLQWVDVVSAPLTAKGKPGHERYFFAGSSPQHVQPYTHAATSRLSWDKTLRAYNSGFRCVSDEPPADLASEPRYSPDHPPKFETAQIRRDLYLKESIRLEPHSCSTFSIHVPWFPQSVWVLDSPESTWGPFGGANDWPEGPEEKWRVPWVVEDGGRRISYERRHGDKRVNFEAWVDGPVVDWKISVENLDILDLGNFCFKTFSPFFSSQERLTQHKLSGGKLVASRSLPLDGTWAASFGWSLGELETGSVVYRSYDGSSYVLYVGEPGCTGGGNGWVPCTHLRGDVQTKQREGGRRFVFLIGTEDEARKYARRG